MDKYIKVKGIATPPPLYNNSCCGQLQCSVLVAGEIAGVTAKQLDTWLSTVTPVRFIHIIKKTEKSYGHIHFGSHALASEFYNAMNQTTFKFGCRNVRFSATKKFSGKLIIYQNEELPKAKSVPHALYRKKGWFVIIIHAPGIKKDQVKVVGGYNQVAVQDGVVTIKVREAPEQQYIKFSVVNDEDSDL
ncbi:10848_t:CDS:2 [Paraglomus brasilianum]|uniref:10848_t:CDS:1 n=1 Tax=Paraglomus brasilianum TaxID=144538 RepID=A0A9N9DSP7_9GLOM|nr:10848_t:CDS:2 [Paraglomus brasilianum]